MSLPLSSLAARASVLLVTAATLVGCASNPSAPAATAPAATAPATPEALVSERAQQRWNHLVQKDFAQAYAYLTPAYRSLKTPDQYAAGFSNGAAWHSAKVEKVSCENAERCTATVNLEVVVLARGFNKPLQSTVYETWLLDEGQWWFYQKN